jgi:hypothetical protein
MKFRNVDFPPHRSDPAAGNRQDALIVQTDQDTTRNASVALSESQNTSDLMTIGGVRTKEFFNFVSSLQEYITI